MLSDRLAEIKAVWDAATPGPWTWSGGSTEDPNVGYAIHHAERRWEDFGMPDGTYVEEDARAMASARQDVPWLIAEVERLRARAAYLALLEAEHQAAVALDRSYTECVEVADWPANGTERYLQHERNFKSWRAAVKAVEEGIGD